MKYILIFMLCTGVISAQEDFEKIYNTNYESNIKKEFINDVYIPSSFEEAFEEIKRLASEEAIEKFKLADEQTVSRKLHFGLGRWMKVNWNFEGGSRLSHKMKEIGVTFPDDMCQLMIVSFHRYLNNQPLKIEEQAKMYFEIRKKENEVRKKRRTEVIVKNN